MAELVQDEVTKMIAFNCALLKALVPDGDPMAIGVVTLTMKPMNWPVLAVERRVSDRDGTRTIIDNLSMVPHALAPMFKYECVREQDKTTWSPCNSDRPTIPLVSQTDDGYPRDVDGRLIKVGDVVSAYNSACTVSAISGLSSVLSVSLVNKHGHSEGMAPVSRCKWLSSPLPSGNSTAPYDALSPRIEREKAGGDNA